MSRGGVFFWLKLIVPQNPSYDALFLIAKNVIITNFLVIRLSKILRYTSLFGIIPDNPIFAI